MFSPDFHRTIETKAKELGFAALGVIEPSKMESEMVALKEAISLSHHGSLSYLERNHHIREEPALLLDGAKSIVVTLSSYKPIKSLKSREIGIASYAYGRDYHFVIKERLRELATFITGERFSYRLFTDSAPIFERSLAVKAGLGFIGRSGMLINREHGVHTLIGVIITDAPLYLPNYGEGVPFGCGECSRCIDGCPTGALKEPFKIDAKRCISYRTIESKEVDGWQGEERVDHSGMFFGCDICIELCPWSKVGESTSIDQFKPLILKDGREITSLTKEEWLGMEETLFLEQLKRSPLKRAGLTKIKSSIRYLIEK